MAGPPVQQAPYIRDIARSATAVLPAAPTPGNTLIGAMFVREGLGSTPAAPVGFSLVAEAACTLPDNWALAVWTRPVAIGDGVNVGPFTINNTGAPSFGLLVVEHAGTLASVGVLATQSQQSVAQLITRTLTPPAGRSSVLWAFAAARDDASPTWAPSGVTEVLDADVPGTGNGPRAFAGYVVKVPTTGAPVVIGATLSAAGKSKGIIAVELRDAAAPATIGEPGGGYWT